MAATATRKLFVNWFSKTLQISDRNGSGFTLPSFVKYETIPFQIVIVEPDLDAIGLPKFARVDISALSLSMAINQTYDSATPLARQTTWTKDESNNVFQGELSLNNSMFNTYLGSNSTMPAYFEIKYGEGTVNSVIYTAPITLQNAVEGVTGATPSPIDEYFTKAQITQQFVPRIMGAGETITFLTPDGLTQRVIGAGNGQIPIDQWFTV